MTTQTEGKAAPAAGWIPDDGSFGVRLMLIRNRMGWTNVSEAARACGLPAENWRLWEQGRMPSRLVTIAVAIATRTGCDLDWLVYGPNKPVLTHAEPGRQLSVEYPVRLRPLDQRVIGRTMEMPVHRDGRRKPKGRLVNLNDRSTGDQRSANRTIRSSSATRASVA